MEEDENGSSGIQRSGSQFISKLTPTYQTPIKKVYAA